MPEKMTCFTPLELLAHLEAQGYRLRVKDGKIFGPRGMEPELAALVKENKNSLIALMTYQCPICNQPIRTVMNTENVLYIECPTEPIHFAHHMPRKRGQPSFVSTGGIRPEKCVECAGPNNGPWKYCDACWLKAIGDDMEQQNSAAD